MPRKSTQAVIDATGMAASNVLQIPTAAAAPVKNPPMRGRYPRHADVVPLRRRPRAAAAREAKPVAQTPAEWDEDSHPTLLIPRQPGFRPGDVVWSGRGERLTVAASYDRYPVQEEDGPLIEDDGTRYLWKYGYRVLREDGRLVFCRAGDLHDEGGRPGHLRMVPN